MIFPYFRRGTKESPLLFRSGRAETTLTRSGVVVDGRRQGSTQKRHIGRCKHPSGACEPELAPHDVFRSQSRLDAAAHLSDLRPVPAITARRSADLAASARHACALAFSPPVAGSSSLKVPQFRTNVFQQSVAASCTPGVCGFPQGSQPSIVPHLEREEMRPTSMSLWTRVSANFHFFTLTARQT